MKSIGASSRSPSPMTIVPDDLGVVHGLAHRRDCGLVGAVAVAASHEARRGDGPGLGGAHRLGDDELVDSRRRRLGLSA